MKAETRAVIISAIVFALSACSGSNDAGNGGGGGGSQIASIPQLTNNFLPMAMRASPSGMALSLLSISDGYAVVTSTSAGVVSTAVTIPFGAGILTDMVLDGKMLYFTGILTSGGSDGLYSVPLGGGTPTQVLLAGSMQVFGSLASDADNLYVDVAGSGANGGGRTDGFLRVSKATGTATPIYTAPAGQSIQFPYVDGTTLYWTETDLTVDQGPANIRSASLAGGGTLAPVQVGILNPGGVAQLVATSGVAFVANLITGSPASSDGGITVSIGDASISIGVGDYAFTPGGNGQPIPVAGGSVPIAANPGVFYYNDTPGLAKATVAANGVSGASTIAASVYPTQMAADGAGSLYYVVYGKEGLHKL
jgi:hypothetical protein